MQSLVERRAEQRQKEEQERERREIEAEEARTRGTPVTKESFFAWRTKFEDEIKLSQQKEEEERLRSLSAKEREELKKQATRPTGTSVRMTNVVQLLNLDV